LIFDAGKAKEMESEHVTDIYISMSTLVAVHDFTIKICLALPVFAISSMKLNFPLSTSVVTISPPIQQQCLFV
jgi:hypothetical protein